MNERPTIAPDETSRFDARLRVLNSVEHHRPILKDLGSLHKEAAKALGKNHPVTVEIASAAAWVSAGHRSATDVVRLYERLIQAVEGREPTPTLRAPAALRTGYARALRRAGNQNALQEYRNLLAAKVADDPQSERRETGIARLNLAVALRSISGVPELMESLSLCEEEVARRTARHGADDRYTLMARAGRLESWLALARFRTPVQRPEEIVAEAEAVTAARERVLGPSHQSTVKSQVTRAEALMNAGFVDRALWQLTALRAQSLSVPTDIPWRIPRLIAECCLLTGDSRDVADGLRYAKQARDIADRLLGPESADAQRCLQVLKAVIDRLEANDDPA